MKECKNKLMLNAYNQFLNSNYYHLSDCYNSYSYAKQKAFDYCLDLNMKYGEPFGVGRIISYNTSIFTFGFMGMINGREAFFYITPTYDRYIYIEDLETLKELY